MRGRIRNLVKQAQMLANGEQLKDQPQVKKRADVEDDEEERKPMCLEM